MAGRLSAAEAEALQDNRRFYDGLWSGSRLVRPERFATWPLVNSLLAPARLEVGPGLRPRLPIAGTHFADISQPALAVLRREGGLGVQATLGALPYPDRSFGLLCALDILEHVEDDSSALRELARVAAPGAALLLSVPLHPAAWTAFDELVGHRRRYDPARLPGLLRDHGFTVERSAPAGMRPRSNRLVALGMWFLVHRRREALWWYNRVFMPLGVRFEKPVALQPGFAATDQAAGVLLVCRRAG